VSEAATAPFEAVPFGRSVSAADVEETLGFLDDWEDRYRYIIDLGKELPALPEALRTEDRYVHGCQSQVWIDHRRDPASGHLQFVVDSDALIVRGLAGIVLAMLNDRPAAEIRDADVEDYFERIDLLGHLSPTRGNGLRAMVQKIRDLAAVA
jgi:cysteine desulfuration protein SufE